MSALASRSLASCQSFLYAFSRRAISQPFRSIANAVLPKHPAVVPLLAPSRGHRMRLDLQSQKAMVVGTYEPEVCRAIQEFAKPGQHAIDLGAHIGYFTLLLAKQVGRSGQVLAFEPNPHNFAALQENVRLNGYDNVVLERKAVSGRDAVVSFRAPEGQTLSSMGSLNAVSGVPYQVESVTLESYWRSFGGAPLDFAKIDIEGSEDCALEASVTLLRRFQPILIIEIHATDDGSPSRSLQILEGEGYRLFRLHGQNRIPATPAARGHVLALPK